MRIAILAIFLALPPARGEVKFAPLKPAPAGTDRELYLYRPDAASVEVAAPLSREDRNSITVAMLKSFTQEQLDQIYFRIGSGPVPEGDFRGTVLVKNPLVQAIESKLIEHLSRRGFKGLVGSAVVKALCRGQDGLECVADYMWKGKRFYSPTSDGATEARNAVPLWVRNSVALKTAGLGAFVEPLSRARLEKFDGSDFMMLFPANIYCGISLIDARRESIVIDYAFGDDFKPFIPQIDGIVGRNGKALRDEIRMIRPGLYLGRAYSDKMFVLNFVLESLQAKSEWRDQCWSGSNGSNARAVSTNPASRQ